ncbi:hypothetical protein KEM52_004579 [Ascosphaera acerosa]|nr:hypothetical protein KEM52_004579 [Ascosphaera acerosa]
MSTIQNLKNFIRHGKQARIAPPPAEPTTDVSTTTIHAEHSKGRDGEYSSHADPTVADASRHQHGHGRDQDRMPPDYAERELAQPLPSAMTRHELEIKQIVAEERQHSSRMPQYPGLERYVLLEKMGDGAFSNVYRARDGHGRYGEVAIKVVRKFEMNPKQRQNILKEVTIMRNLDHPNIVKLLEFSESPQFYYIILELCPGGELFHQVVRLTYFSEELSRHVILQVARAIEYLHEESGVVHRDIKPENLLFYPIPVVPSRHPKPLAPGDEDKVDEGEFQPGRGGGGIGQVKVADFGLSKVIWDSQTMTPCGTVGYTAPEIVKDERYSKSVDMWALGCVLYTLLCGFPPFYDESIQVLTEKVAKGQYTFLSPWWDDISKSAKDLVSHLLTVDPETRYTIREFLSHPWITQTDEETVAAADAPPLMTPLAPGLGPLPAPHPAFIETPLAERRAMDFRSPGAINLREVFDVGYAVHRQEEEDKIRKKQGKALMNSETGQFRAALNALNEVDSEEEEEQGPHAAHDGSQRIGQAHDDESAVASDSDPDVASAAQQQSYSRDLANVQDRLRSTNISGKQQHAPVRTHAAAAPSARSYQPPQGTTRQQQQQPHVHYAPRTTTTRSGRQQQQQQPQQQQGGYGSHPPAVAAIAREQAAKRAAQPFELSLGNATLLEKRRRAAAASGGAAGGAAASVTTPRGLPGVNPLSSPPPAQRPMQA